MTRRLSLRPALRPSLRASLRRSLLVMALAAPSALPGVARAQVQAQPQSQSQSQTQIQTQAQASDRLQDPAAVRQLAQDYLTQQLAMLPGQAHIQIDEIQTERLPACDALSAFSNGPLRPRARMSVGVRCTAPKPWNLYVQATVSVPGQYYVAARPIGAGETLQMADLTPRDGDLINLPPGAITDPQSVIGMSAAYRIGMGQPIRANTLRSAGSVQRGQMVRITARGPGFVVSSEGQVMQNASPGATVEVKTSSGQIVSGVLQRQGNVEVPL